MMGAAKSESWVGVGQGHDKGLANQHPPPPATALGTSQVLWSTRVLVPPSISSEVYSSRARLLSPT